MHRSRKKLKPHIKSRHKQKPFTFSKRIVTICDNEAKHACNTAQLWGFTSYLHSKTFSVCIHFNEGWEFYLFLRKGYYKDAKLKGEIKFSKGQANEVVSVNFLTTVFHPYVDYSSGKVDLAKLCSNEYQASGKLLGLFSALKSMFTEG
jgi:hypothetical protein